MKDRLLLTALVLSMPVGVGWLIYRSIRWRPPAPPLEPRLEEYGSIYPVYPDRIAS